ncbi:MAG TPA: hypothetical protein VMF31_07840 [Solirubrobacterales bacterium]|nr:hypothetical protein [Solirubrobacterales bacterium]
MNEHEARQRVAELTATSPDRETHSWIPRKGADGEWSIVKLAVPSPKSPETVKSKSGDDQAIKDDPRSAMEQSFPPWGVGI